MLDHKNPRTGRKGQQHQTRASGPADLPEVRGLAQEEGGRRGQGGEGGRAGVRGRSPGPGVVEAPAPEGGRRPL